MQALVPGDNLVITWLIIGALSAWGGLVRYILDKNNEEDEWSWAAVISQVIVSGFTGLIGGLISFEGGISRYMTFAIAGLFGAMGSSALQYLWHRFFGQEIPPKQ
ncbi:MULTISPECIES: phage holin family protein [Yersinia]|uniref:phage holin family protein n=1 Tax=Yersinia TaxID=629 RepID=UPI0011A36F0D|nr:MULTISPECIES: phage holin family protein [Yersinia]MDA5545061.1 phage holin family protein [Yersinia rochesterensis]MDN0108336.1 phage holin family protein [Yersinia rochesterensis]MDR5017959.1 phage holin family protein [Yersinia rochesterensis]UZM74742.1 phage holin family protein [Yersinia sp. SCPM-O-B-9106 (C-191)]